MIQWWFDAVRLGSYTPAVIERRSIPRARARMQKCILNVTHPTGQKQLLVDVSVICRDDVGTGIQRVVRSVLSHLLSCPPTGYSVRPVAATRKQSYHYIDWYGVAPARKEGGAVFVRPGDVFLGLDLSAHIITAHRHQLAEWKAQGASLHFIVYDLLPLHHPEWFPGKLVAAFRRWIKVVAMLADGAICISPTVEQDLAAWFEDRYGLAIGRVPTRVIPMGWDIDSAGPSHGLPPKFAQILPQIQRRKTALMVGTLEPRKGHAQVLEAFEQLWLNGKDYNLVIAGRPGWRTQALQAKLRNHPQRDQRLFWFEAASDEALLSLYRACDGVVIASLAEGFGLPLIEAHGHGKPVLARNLPVFRDQPHGDVKYFSARDPRTLSAIVDTWLERIAECRGAPTGREHPPSWQHAVECLVAVLGLKSQNLPFKDAPPEELKLLSTA